MLYYILKIEMGFGSLDSIKAFDKHQRVYFIKALILLEVGVKWAIQFFKEG